jgi:hypothetical protein
MKNEVPMKFFPFLITLVVTLPSLAVGQEGSQAKPDETPLVNQEQPRIKTPEEIQRELDEDEKLFKHAKEMFDPWYAGPLLTGSASMMPPGSFNIQPYVFVTDNYAAWDHERKTVHTPHRVVLNPSINGLQFGLTNWMDMTVTTQAFMQWQDHKRGTGWGDSSVGVGFPLLRQDLYKPGIKLVITETIPTGRYQKLNPAKLGLDSTGAGSYQTSIGLRVAKIFFWSYKHPLSLRWSYSYIIPSSVHVKGFNSYGGGYGTSGRVHPGNYQQANFAFEYSFTQRWVFANDFVYVWSNKTTFHGKRGMNADGTPAIVGSGSSDQLSLAPAIEYNPNANLSFLGGVWFDVYGRNTSKFISGIVSVEYTFSW